MRAGVRYDEADGGRLAAAVTYYAFFATFALGLLGFAIFAFLLDDPSVLRAVERYVAENLPHIDVQALRNARNTAGIIAFVGIPVTGWFWADVLRSSIRKMWRLPEYPGRLVVRILVDLLVLAGLGILLAASLAVAYLTSTTAYRLVDAADTDGTSARWVLATVGLVLGIGVNTVLAGGMLTGLPRVRMPVRRVLGPALLVAVGLELLKTLGRLYVQRTEANPTYHLVAGSVGLLVFLNAVNQLVLFAAALTATSTAGRPADLAAEADDPGVNNVDQGNRHVGVQRAAGRRPQGRGGTMQVPGNEATAVIADRHGFDAPAEVVYGVLTDPDRTTRWLPAGMSAEPAAAGQVRVRAGGQIYEYDVSSAPDELRVEWRARDPAVPQGAAWVADAPAGGCVVHAEVSVPGGDADRQRAEELLAEAMRHLRRDVDDNFNAG